MGIREQPERAQVHIGDIALDPIDKINMFSLRAEPVVIMDLDPEVGLLRACPSRLVALSEPRRCPLGSESLLR